MSAIDAMDAIDVYPAEGTEDGLLMLLMWSAAASRRCGPCGIYMATI